MIKSFRIIVLAGSAMLGGCTYGSQFDCAVGEGNRCASISENVKKIDEGFYEQKTTDSPIAQVEKFYFREDF